MSVLVRGMEMPKDCENCPMLDDNGDYPTCILTWASQGYNWIPIGHRMRNCPLVEVPTPHGRLIDADAIADIFNMACAECKESCMEFDGVYADCDNCIFFGVKESFLNAPTVIEAEGET